MTENNADVAWSRSEALHTPAFWLIDRGGPRRPVKRHSDCKSSSGSLYICRYGYSYCVHCFESGWIARFNSRVTPLDRQRGEFNLTAYAARSLGSRLALGYRDRAVFQQKRQLDYRRVRSDRRRGHDRGRLIPVVAHGR